MNAEGLKHSGERLSGDGAVLTPRPIWLSVQPVEQGGGRDALRVAVMVKGFTQVVEKLKTVFAIVDEFLFKNSGQGFAGTLGPFAADEAGDLENRLDHVLAARGEAGRKLRGGEGGQSLDVRPVFFYPAMQAIVQ